MVCCGDVVFDSHVVIRKVEVHMCKAEVSMSFQYSPKVLIGLGEEGKCSVVISRLKEHASELV